MTSAPASRYSRWILAIRSGRVSDSRSLLPLRSRGESRKRSARYCASPSRNDWIMVPIAPSSSTIRSSSSRRNSPMRSCRMSVRRGPLPGPHAERMADGVGELGTVQRVEVELVDPVFLQALHLIDRDTRGDQPPRIGVVVEPVEAFDEPRRNARTATLSKAEQLREARDRQDARHDLRGHAARRALVAETQEDVGVEEELRDRARRAGVDLGAQIVEVE